MIWLIDWLIENCFSKDACIHTWCIRRGSFCGLAVLLPTILGVVEPKKNSMTSGSPVFHSMFYGGLSDNNKKEMCNIFENLKLFYPFLTIARRIRCPLFHSSPSHHCSSKHSINKSLWIKIYTTLVLVMRLYFYFY